MQGKFADADDIFERVLAIDMQSFGEEHPTVVDDLNNRAAMLYSQVNLGTCWGVSRKVVLQPVVAAFFSSHMFNVNVEA